MKAVLALTSILALLTAQTPAMAQDHDHASMQSPLQQSGQGAFGAIQEAIEHLEADPNTDWSRVNLESLRQHLIDMDEVTLRADIRMEPIEGGARFHVSGAGRTLPAIRRMVAAHVRILGDTDHWRLSSEESSAGAVVTAIGKSPGDTQRIRGLGLIGIMAEGTHHQPHHWMMASGANPH